MDRGKTPIQFLDPLQFEAVMAKPNIGHYMRCVVLLFVCALPISTACHKSKNPAPQQVSASQSSVSVNPANGLAANGSDSSTITVVLRNAGGSTLAGWPVGFAATGSGNTVSPASGVTDSTGTVTAQLSSTVGETKTVVIQANPGSSAVALIATPTVVFTGGGGSFSFANATVVATPNTSVVANGVASSTLTATLLDANSNPVVGQTVQFIVTGNGNTVVQPAGLSDAFGVALGSVVSTVAGTKTVICTVNPGASQVLLTSTPTLGFIADQSTMSASLSTVVASPTTNLLANGSASSTLTITVLDANSNPIAGQTVQIAATGSNNSITQPASVTDANGVASGSITTTKAETKTVTVRVNPSTDNLLLNAQPTLVFIGDASNLSASLSTVTANPVTNIGANGTAISTITVTAKDVNGNPVSGQSVSLAATGAGNSITQPAATLTDGSTTGTITSTVAETKTITATLNPGASQVVVTQVATVTFVADFLADDDILLHYAEGTETAIRQRIWDVGTKTWGAESTVPTSNQPIMWVVTKNRPTGGGFEKIMGILAAPASVPTLEVMSWNGASWSQDFSKTGIVAGNEDKRGFDLDYEASSGDRMIVYSDNTNNPLFRSENSGAWSTETAIFSTPPGSAAVLWVELVVRPGTNEIALAYGDGNRDLHVVIWNGTSWDTANAATLTINMTNSVQKVFDAAFETSSGDLMVVWGESQSKYATKAAGVSTWSAVGSINAPVSGAADFVDLASEPGTDRIAGGFFDYNPSVERLGLATWTGSAWVNIGEYDSDLHNVVASGDIAGGVAWVGSSGVAICVYPNRVGGTLDWARWTSGSGWVVQTDVVIAGKGITESILMRSLKTQNRVMTLFSDSNSKLYAADYDGTTWTVTSPELESSLSSVTSMPFWFLVK